MVRECKKLVTDINRKADLENKLPEYAYTLSKQYNHYATVKMCMNYFTMKSMLEEKEAADECIRDCYNEISSVIDNYLVGETEIDDAIIEKIRLLRKKIEYRMKNLTAYTDGFEVYEYILNRIEARVNGDEEAVDISGLSEAMFRYVFAENDTVVVNSKLQLIMAQLPVRMTKNKFFDVVTNTLSIYKGGEKSSVDDFVDMLRDSVLINKPGGFETEYPKLYELYTELEKADYSEMDKESFDKLTAELKKAAELINEAASAYTLMQEIVNDTFAILLTKRCLKGDVSTDASYKASLAILKESTGAISVDELTESLMPKFVALEGVQEEVYESIVILEAVFDDVKLGNAKIIEDIGLKEVFDSLSIVEKLMATSLFIDLDKEDSSNGETASNEYIMKLRDIFTDELSELFKDKKRMVIRSMMCKLLASMPIFLNTQQEIKNYFDYVLTNCKDDSELMACDKLIRELMEE